MLEVSQLTRCYGSFVAVDNVSFTIGKGEIVGLLGHNGAGKTTIMKMLSGYLEPDQGRVSIAGINIATDGKIAQRHLGYLPESLPLYPELSVADYLDYAAELKGLSDEHKHAEVRRAVQATDIGAVLLAQINTLSRGYRQRVGVAQAILGRPRLLIMDEPTNGLDPTQTEHMRQLIREIARDATVILSTHIMQEVDAVCDRVLILRDGQLAVDARLEDLRRSDHLLLDTSMPPDSAAEQLTAVAGIEVLEVLDQPQRPSPQLAVHHYRLKLSTKTAEREAADRVCAALARAVFDAGAELYRLQPEYRDLETLFREVSSAASSALQHESEIGEVVSHAA